MKLCELLSLMQYEPLHFILSLMSIIRQILYCLSVAARPFFVSFPYRRV